MLSAPNLAYSADSSENGYTPNKLPLETKGGHLGGFRGSKKSGEAVKQLHRLAPNLVHVGGFVWEWTYRLNTIRPTIPQGHFGGFRGHKFRSLGKLSNGWTD